MDADIARRLGRLIDEERPEIERRWLEHVQKDVREAKGVSLTQLRDGIPDYLVAMVKLLEAADFDLLNGHATSAWADVAREHGITRSGSGSISASWCTSSSSFGESSTRSRTGIRSWRPGRSWSLRSWRPQSRQLCRRTWMRATSNRAAPRPRASAS